MKVRLLKNEQKVQRCKKYFDEGLWNIAMVKNAVVKGWITSEEFEEITGVEYEA